MHRNECVKDDEHTFLTFRARPGAREVLISDQVLLNRASSDLRTYQVRFDHPATVSLAMCQQESSTLQTDSRTTAELTPFSGDSLYGQENWRDQATAFPGRRAVELPGSLSAMANLDHLWWNSYRSIHVRLQSTHGGLEPEPSLVKLLDAHVNNISSNLAAFKQPNTETQRLILNSERLQLCRSTMVIDPKLRAVTSRVSVLLVSLMCA